MTGEFGTQVAGVAARRPACRRGRASRRPEKVLASLQLVAFPAGQDARLYGRRDACRYSQLVGWYGEQLQRSAAFMPLQRATLSPATPRLTQSSGETDAKRYECRAPSPSHRCHSSSSSLLPVHFTAPIAITWSVVRKKSVPSARAGVARQMPPSLLVATTLKVDDSGRTKVSPCSPVK